MELKVNIGYQDLWELIKQLPSQQIEKLKKDLAKVEPEEVFPGKKEHFDAISPLPEPINNENESTYDKEKFLELLINGPVATAEDLKSHKEASDYIREWKIESF